MMWVVAGWLTGENENNCPLFWVENPKCTTWDGRVNECGDPISDAARNSPLGAQQGTCFQELEVGNSLQLT
jgi:hypothetical protein